MSNKILNKPIRGMKQFNHVLHKYESYIIVIGYCILLGCLSSAVILFLKERSNPSVTLKPAAVSKQEQNSKWMDAPTLNRTIFGDKGVDLIIPHDWDSQAYLKDAAPSISDLFGGERTALAINKRLGLRDCAMYRKEVTGAYGPLSDFDICLYQWEGKLPNGEKIAIKPKNDERDYMCGNSELAINACKQQHDVMSEDFLDCYVANIQQQDAQKECSRLKKEIDDKYENIREDI